MTDITIYKRHSADCKHKNDRYSKKCDCRIWLQYTNGDRVSAKTRSWEKAKELVRKLEGGESAKRYTVREAIDIYLVSCKRKLTVASMRKPRRMTSLLLMFCESKNIRHLDQLTPVLLDEMRQGWKFKSENSSSMFMSDSQMRKFFSWTVKMDMLTKDPYAKLDRYSKSDPVTLPLTPDEMKRIIVAVNEISSTETNKTRHLSQATKYKIKALILLQRWSGLSIVDALTLSRSSLHDDNSIELYRTKTGEPVLTILPANVADLLRLMPNEHAGFFFWNGEEPKSSLVGRYSKWLAMVFDQAGISRDRTNGGMTLSHRFRDTFAVEFLKTGGRMEDLSMLLGHSNIGTTQKHYNAWVPARKERLLRVAEEAMAKMERLD